MLLFCVCERKSPSYTFTRKRGIKPECSTGNCYTGTALKIDISFSPPVDWLYLI